MKRVFCWFPTPVLSSRYWQDGFRWFKFAWLGSDGKHYTTREAAEWADNTAARSKGGEA